MYIVTANLLVYIKHWYLQSLTRWEWQGEHQPPSTTASYAPWVCMRSQNSAEGMELEAGHSKDPSHCLSDYSSMSEIGGGGNHAALLIIIINIIIYARTCRARKSITSGGTSTLPSFIFCLFSLSLWLHRIAYRRTITDKLSVLCRDWKTSES